MTGTFFLWAVTALVRVTLSDSFRIMPRTEVSSQLIVRPKFCPGSGGSLCLCTSYTQLLATFTVLPVPAGDNPPRSMASGAPRTSPPPTRPHLLGGQRPPSTRSFIIAAFVDRSGQQNAGARAIVDLLDPAWICLTLRDPLSRFSLCCCAGRVRTDGRCEPVLRVLHGLQRVHGQGRGPDQVRPCPAPQQPAD